MQESCRFSITVLALLVVGACGESQAPSLHGPSFVASTIDGKPWIADTAPGDLYALLGPQRVIFSARRQTDQPAAEEVLGVEIGTTDVFAERSYPLAAAITGFATFRVTTQLPGGLTQAFYSTTPDHTGTLTIEGSSAQDSVVIGHFAFEAVPLSGFVEVHHITGQFRVRYATAIP